MIEEMTAKKATLTEEIAGLNAEIAANQDGLAKSTEIRKKDKADFVAEEKNAIVSISGLKTAVMVLACDTPDSAECIVVPLATDTSDIVSCRFQSSSRR